MARLVEIRRVKDFRIDEFCLGLNEISGTHTIVPNVDKSTMQYDIGMSDKEIASVKKNLSNSDKNMFDNRNYRDPVAANYWENDMAVRLNYEPKFLNLDNVIDFIKYKFLSVSDYVYSSEIEMSNGNKPLATHYLYNRDNENMLAKKKIDISNALTVDLCNTSLETKKNILMIINNEDVSNQTEDYISVELDSIKNDKDKSYELRLLLDKSKKNDDSRAELHMQAVVRYAMISNILKKTSKGIFYFQTNLGYSEEEVVTNLSKDENQELLINIKDKLK